MKSILVVMTGFVFTPLMTTMASAAEPRPLEIGVTQDVSSFDWNVAIDAPSSWVLTHLTRRLFHLEPNGDVVYDLAASEKTTGLETKIRIREDVTWSDGRALKAQDFVDSIDRVRDSKTASPAAAYLEHLVTATSGGDHELVLKWKSPRADVRALFSHTAFAPVRKDLIAKWPREWATPERWVGLGPYLLSGYKLEQKISLVPRTKEFLHPIDVRVLTEASTLDSLFDANELDVVVGVTSTKDRKTSRTEKVFPVDRVSALLLNQESVALPTRKIVAGAIERDSIVKAVGPGPLSQGTWMPTSNMSPPRDSIRSGEKSSGKFKLAFAQRDDHRIAAQVIQSQMKAVGLEIELEPLDLKIFLQRLRTGDVQMALVSFGSGIPDPSGWFVPFKKHGSYGMLTSNSKLDEIVAKIEAERDPGARLRLVREAEKALIVDSSVLVPIYREAKWIRAKPDIFNAILENGVLRMEKLRINASAKAP